MKVRLYIRVRLDNGTRQYVNPVYAANGKLKPFYAWSPASLNTTQKASTTSGTARTKSWCGSLSARIPNKQ